MPPAEGPRVRLAPPPTQATLTRATGTALSCALLRTGRWVWSSEQGRGRQGRGRSRGQVPGRAASVQSRGSRAAGGPARSPHPWRLPARQTRVALGQAVYRC